jgi:Leucine-rich repeat (LRR) protein
MDLRNRDLQDGIYLDACDLSSQPDFSNVHAGCLTLAENSIHSISDDCFPQGVQILDFSYNYIHDDGLPFQWPDTIEELYLTHNSICNYDDDTLWPDHLKVLCISKNPLQQIPSDLPESLEKLYLDRTQLKQIQKLPSNLKVLSVESSYLRSLPKELPHGLEKLFAARNFLHSTLLPRHWGFSLQVLNLEKNKLIEFPKNLPNTLRVLRLNNNNITQIPEALPESLVYLTIANNKVRKVQLSKRKKPIQFVYLANNQLTQSIQNEQEQKQIQWGTSIIEVSNWTNDVYIASAKTIQAKFRNFRLKKILRTWRKLGHVRQELQASAMHPSRAGQFENVSPDWGHWGC